MHLDAKLCSICSTQRVKSVFYFICSLCLRMWSIASTTESNTKSGPGWIFFSSPGRYFPVRTSIPIRPAACAPPISSRTSWQRDAKKISQESVDQKTRTHISDHGHLFGINVTHLSNGLVKKGSVRFSDNITLKTWRIFQSSHESPGSNGQPFLGLIIATFVNGNQSSLARL